MYEYIEQVKEVQLEMLLEVDRICKENGIKYQLFAGTLLGAVRHKGFIPWDDDIDICMLRKDYNIFLNVCKERLDKNFFLQNFETEKEVIGNISRIRKNNTLQVPENISEHSMHHGIWIDVFPMDKILPDKLIGKLQIKLLNIIKIIKPRKIKKIAYDKRYKLLRYVTIGMHFVLKPISLYNLNRIQNWLACWFEKVDTIYSTCLASEDRRLYLSFMIENSKFDDIIEGHFEGHKFPIPKNYHEVLTRNYGDYMTPPPIEQQKPHHGIIKVSFDTTSDIENK